MSISTLQRARINRCYRNSIQNSTNCLLQRKQWPLLSGMNTEQRLAARSERSERAYSCGISNWRAVEFPTSKRTSNLFHPSVSEQEDFFLDRYESEIEFVILSLGRFDSSDTPRNGRAFHATSMTGETFQSRVNDSIIAFFSSRYHFPFFIHFSTDVRMMKMNERQTSLLIHH